jgi:primosomal protein N' (replication factor Y) (superfamily II helicase)
MQIVPVLLPIPSDKAYSYSYTGEQQLKKGDVVKVPLGKKLVWGVVWGKNADETSEKIKEIIEVSDYTLPLALIEFLEKVAAYNLAPLGMVASQAVSVASAAEHGKGRKTYTEQLYHYVPPILSEEQQHAADKLRKMVEAAQFEAVLLDGVTGSGKTEVFSAAIDEAISLTYCHPLEGGRTHKVSPGGMGNDLDLSPPNLSLPNSAPPHLLSRSLLAKAKGGGNQALVLLPEIMLATQIVDRLAERFGAPPTIWHSSLTPAERRENWRAIASGKAKFIAGARSALFLPYKNLGLIVVDEEHEQAYKQEEVVVYHARDMAVLRASIEKIPVILVSASPSIETIHNVQAKKYSYLHLGNRHGEAVLPEITLVDMRKSNLPADKFIAPATVEKLAENLELKQQSLLFLNRRGYSPLVICRKCGFRFQSPDGSNWMVLHKPKNRPAFLQCHHSGYTMRMPDKCPECSEQESFTPCGPGVERVEEEVRALLPEARVEVLTSDTIANQKVARDVMGRIDKGEVDIIIGTQMVAKGHHFPNLTFVGVVDADLGLEGGDLRAAEKTFQLMLQVAGRAGRGDLKGTAYIQTFQPESAVMQCIASGDRQGFIETETNRRELGDLPPFTRMAALVISGTHDDSARNYARDLASHAPQIPRGYVLGPSPAPLHFLRGKFRHRFLLIAPRNFAIQKCISNWLAAVKTPSSVRVKVDIDPYSFY